MKTKLVCSFVRDCVDAVSVHFYPEYFPKYAFLNLYCIPGMQILKLTLVAPGLWDPVKTSGDSKPARSWSPRTKSKNM